MSGGNEAAVTASPQGRASELLAALRAALSAAAVCTDDSATGRHARDWSGCAAQAPLAVVYPVSTAQVAEVLRLCHRHAVPVVPQGGLTGLAGGAVPVQGGIAMALERMNRIEDVDARTGVLRTQAGATLQAVQDAAAGAGQCFGVDLGARGSCQIGGNIATNAGGNGVVQFGMMRDQVLGLEVVLADGTVLDLLQPMLKNNAGYDLKQHFIGSEGTLGVVTRALLKLHPAPRARATLLAALPDCASAMELLRRLKADFPGQLAAFELMWEDFYTASLAWTGLPAPFTHSPCLAVLAELSGADEALLQQQLLQSLETALEAGTVLDGVLAQSRAQADALWRLREGSAELPVHMQAINFDISLPLERLGAFAEQCQQALSARWPGHRTVRFGHLGDGNLHLSTDARAMTGLSFAQAEAAVEALIYGLLREAGGSVSAEHGIGLHKKPYLNASRGPAEQAAMRAIKQALDPRSQLNPGKVFDPV